MTSGDDAIDLTDGALAVRVTREGGGLLDARFEGRSFLRPGGGADGRLACFPLVPFGNRVERNGFALDDRYYRFQPNSGDPLYLHGDGWLTRWSVQSQDLAEVELSLRHHPDDASPYDYHAVQTIALTNDRLTLTLSVVNSGANPMLFGLGQHPFFLRTPETRLTARALTCWSERDGHLPGEPGAVPARFDFSCGRSLPHGFVNNAFGGWDGRAAIEWPELGLAADIETAGHDVYMLYTPADTAEFFCFEPMTHLPNGHHMPDFGGLRLLEPGQGGNSSVTISLRRMP